MKPSGKWRSAACFVALFAMVGLGLAGAGCAVPPGGGKQAFDGQSREKGAETAESEPAQQKGSADVETGGGLANWIDQLSQHCGERCSAAPDDQTTQNRYDLSFFAYPSCLVSKLFDVCNLQDSDAAIGIAIFVIIFAVLTRQAIIGYLQMWRLSFALFLAVFFSAVAGYFTILGTPEIVKLDSPIFGFAVLVFASVFFAGVLSFWTKYMLDLLAVVLLAMVLVLLDSLDETNPLLRDSLSVVTGMAGGVWLYWWREIRSNRKRRQPADGRKTLSPASDAASGEARLDKIKGASTQVFRLPLRWRWPRRSSSNMQGEGERND